MKLNKILEGITPTQVLGNITNKEVTGITFDSRKAEPHELFVALKGENFDGHEYIPTLAEKKLTAIICEHIPQNLDRFDDTVFIEVADSHEALGIIASNFFGKPSREMVVIGVTGTNGKTTIATLLYDMVRKAGIECGLLSTVANYINGVKSPSTHTTPDAISLNRMLRQMADTGCCFVAMEVSSHAAHQKRIAGIEFKGAVFTNLTRDHLDYHKDFAAYRDAKKIFFDNLGTDAFALVNKDDPNADFMLQNTSAAKYHYSMNETTDFTGRIIEKYIDSTVMSLNGTEINTLFTGLFNAYNLTAVYGTMMLLGFDEESILQHLSQLNPVTGRFQTFRSGEGKTAIVDYAHTPDALLNVLRTINDVKRRNSQIITVIGAGGNRDKGKRPQMGKIASQWSDKIVVTSDNPRFEEPDDIIRDIINGIEPEMRKKVFIVPNRHEAIKIAVSMAHAEDIVLVAGKGHEDYQEIKGIRHHFSDADEIIEALK